MIQRKKVQRDKIFTDFQYYQPKEKMYTTEVMY